MGRGGEATPKGDGAAAAVAGAARKTLLIDGVVYDVTNFRHPGGSIIKYLTTDGSAYVDATNAYREFHCRSKTADKFLKSLPKVKVDGSPKMLYSPEEQKRRDALTKDYAAFREQLVKEGMFDPSPLHVVYRCTEVVALFALSFWLLAQHGNLPAQAFGAVVSGIAQGRCGWLMHEGGHYSMTGNIKIDVRLQEIIYGVGCGMSGAWWRNQHNKHHATPQKLKHDVDLDTLPLVAFNEKIAARVRPGSFQARWLRIQGYIFAPISCLLVGLFWTLFLHPRHMLRTSRKLEMASIAARYALWFVITTQIGFAPREALGLYLLTFGIGCTYIFTNFAVSHTHLPVTEEDEYLHWVEYGALHTTNVSIKSWFVTWWMSYLNFQIEHHLFPCMPQFRHPRISNRVKELFERHGLVYDNRSYTQALRDTFNNLHSVGQGAGQAPAKAN